MACFGTTTPKLVRLADWRKDQGIETVAMESMGEYWIPLFEILDSCCFKVVLANAHQFHYVPGSKPLDHGKIQMALIVTLCYYCG